MAVRFGFAPVWLRSQVASLVSGLCRGGPKAVAAASAGAVRRFDESKAGLKAEVDGTWSRLVFFFFGE